MSLRGVSKIGQIPAADQPLGYGSFPGPFPCGGGLTPQRFKCGWPSETDFIITSRHLVDSGRDGHRFRSRLNRSPVVNSSESGIPTVLSDEVAGKLGTSAFDCNVSRSMTARWRRRQAAGHRGSSFENNGEIGSRFIA